MVHAYQKGKLKNPPKKVKEVAKHISEEDAEHFARTKHKGLPEKKAYMQGFMDKLAEYLAYMVRRKLEKKASASVKSDSH